MRTAERIRPADQPELLILGPGRPAAVDAAAWASRCRRLIRDTRPTRDDRGRPLTTGEDA